MLYFISFVHISHRAIAAARNYLKARCQIVRDVITVVNTLDQTRLLHLKCSRKTLISNPHIASAAEVEMNFWRSRTDNPSGNN